MADYSEEIADAKELIAESGQEVIWRKLPHSVGNQPWRLVSLAAIDYKVNIVFVNRKKENVELLRSNGDGVQIGSSYGLMGAVDFEPNIKDVVIRDGKEYRITSIDIIQPSGEPILYNIDFDV